MTDIAITTPAQHQARLRAAPTLACGLLGGFALGAAARAWMRLISDTPEFTWSGTIFIVAGFTVFGLAQSTVAIGRRRIERRWALTCVRVVGFIAMMPLFNAAGAIMFPTVMGAGLARARVDWNRWVRALFLLVSLGPVVLVASQLVGDFGWSLQSLVGFIALLALYGLIVWATQFVLAPQLDGWRTPRWSKVVAGGLVFMMMVRLIIAILIS